MSELLFVLFSAALANNIVLHQALAIDPATREDGNRVHALGLATLVMMALAVGIGQALVQYGLRPFQLDYLRLFVFLPLCVLLVEPVSHLLQRQLPGWSFAGLKPLLLGNAALLGLSLQVSDAALSLLQTLAVTLGSGLGFWLVIFLLDDLRQRTDNTGVPAALRGLPITLVSAGIMAVAFLGFNGLFRP